jgi:hypothetical protein
LSADVPDVHVSTGLTLLIGAAVLAPAMLSDAGDANLIREIDEFHGSRGGTEDAGRAAEPVAFVPAVVTTAR